jgi:DNA topoisomerase-1
MATKSKEGAVKEKSTKAVKKVSSPAVKKTVRKKLTDQKSPAGGGTLIVVESPTKARTLTKILGPSYAVRASVGHLKDLPPSRLGVNLEKGFELEFIVNKDKKTILSDILGQAKNASEIYLASDPDREGEAIAYHIASELSGLGRPIRRVLIHELTESGIRHALSLPGDIDGHKVEAQMARRALDRIVGYTLSPLLWDRVRRGLSAGRVQSVAVRLICDREEAIRAFRQEEYWTIECLCQVADDSSTGRASKDETFRARLERVAGEKPQLSTADMANQVVARLQSEKFRIVSVESSEKKRNPSPPLTTSRLQQEGANRFRFAARRTMMAAQKLYEGIDLPGKGPVGLITYMRTDSIRIAPEAQEAARKWIAAQYPEALPKTPNVFKNRKGIQDAHEAIRPSDPSRTPESLKGILEGDLYKVYDLIWQRFMESQMSSARYLQTVALIEGNEKDVLKASGRVLLDPGFLRLRGETVTVEGDQTDTPEEGVLPPLAEGQLIDLRKILPEQHFTEPPPRYSEGTLIKELEEKGIGRPSTFATIMSTILEREYVEKKESRFFPTDLGERVNKLLVASFPDLVSPGFTAKMEEELDSVEEGRRDYKTIVGEFYQPFNESLSKARSGGMENLKQASLPTDIDCPACGKKMVRKWGKNGGYLACSGYPECKTSMNYIEDENGIHPDLPKTLVDELCEVCGKPMVIKKGRFGTFLACTGYPECKTTRPWPPKDEQKVPLPPVPENTPPCEVCGKPMVVRKGRFGPFLACTGYPKCKTARPMPTGIACAEPGCSGEIVPRRGKRGTFYGCSRYPDCTATFAGRPVLKPCPVCSHPFLVESGKSSRAVLVCPREGCGYESTPD